MASEDGNSSSFAEYKNRSLIAVHVVKKVYYIRRKVLTATNFLQKIIEVTGLGDRIMLFTYLEDSNMSDTLELTFLPTDELGCQAFLLSNSSRVWVITDNFSSLSKELRALASLKFEIILDFGVVDAATGCLFCYIYLP